MKKVLLMFVVTLLSFTSVYVSVMADENIDVILDGSVLEFDVPAQVINERTMVPVRKIFESMGATVEWDNETQKITAQKEDTTVIMQINNNIININGTDVALDVPPQIVDTRTLVPVRAVAESFNANVNWDGDTRSVIITSGTITDSGELNSITLWEQGGLSAKGRYNTDKIIRTIDYVSDEVKYIYAENDCRFMAVCYNEDDTFAGFWTGKGIDENSSRGAKIFYLNIGQMSQYKVKIILMKTDSSKTITIEDSANIHFLDEQKAKSFGKGATLTFIDDDGNREALKNWESITDELRINITAALVTSYIDDKTHISWDEVERLQSKGYEFVSHTDTHLKLSTATEVAIASQLKRSVDELKKHGCENRYLVYPYNATNANTISVVSDYFDAAIGMRGGRDNILPIFTYNIDRVSINEQGVTVSKEYKGKLVEVAEFKSLDTLKEYVDNAIINDGWLIIMTHLRNDESFYYDEEAREMIIELCKYAQEKGMSIENFGDAFDKYKNIDEDNFTESTNGASYNITDCNGVVHYK